MAQVDASADIMPENKRRVRLARAWYSRFKRELYDMEAAPFARKLCMLKAEVMETLLYGCITWTLRKEHFHELRTAHYGFLLRVIGFQHDNAQTTSCRTPRPLSRHNARASRRPSASGVSCLPGPYSGRIMSD